MRDRTSWLKLIGTGWLITGVVVLLWGLIALLPGPSTPPFSVALPSKVQAFAGVFRTSPWSESAAVIAGLFFMAAGWAMIRRRSWAQTVMVPAHLLLAVYALVGLITAHVLRNRPEVWWNGGTALFATLAVLNGGLALLLNSLRTTEALSWLPLRTTPIIPLRCEFCGSTLDPETKLCPQCNAVSESIRGHVAAPLRRAKLVSLDDDTEYWIEPEKKTFIGRSLTGNDINMNNPTVSRRHARIEYEEGNFVLAALKDSNGTFINDTLVRKRTIRDGDEVRFGRAGFRFVIVNE